MRRADRVSSTIVASGAGSTSSAVARSCSDSNAASLASTTATGSPSVMSAPSGTPSPGAPPRAARASRSCGYPSKPRRRAARTTVAVLVDARSASSLTVNAAAALGPASRTSATLASAADMPGSIALIRATTSDGTR